MGRSQLMRSSARFRVAVTLLSLGMLTSALTTAAQAPVCAGDCNGDRTVAINEVITCVNIGLGLASPGGCPSCDSSGDGTVTINEIIAAVNIGLGLLPCDGVPPPRTPTPPVPVDPGIDEVLDSMRADPDMGAFLYVASDDDELDGASLDVPPRSIREQVAMAIGTGIEPEGSPFGRRPVGALWALAPSGLTFSQAATLSLPLAPGATRDALYIGRWDAARRVWEDLGGIVAGDFIATDISHLSIYGVFERGRSLVRVENGAQDGSDIELTYVNGPAPIRDTPADAPHPAYRPLPEGGVDLREGESALMSLLPGRYLFVVSYPRFGVANPLYFTIPALERGADDGNVDQTITITLDGAVSTAPVTNESIDFDGVELLPQTNQRPTVRCNASVPEGVAVDRFQDGARVNVGPIRIEQMRSPGAVVLQGDVRDPDGDAPLYLFWTWSYPSLPTVDELGSSPANVGRTFSPNPLRAGLYTVYLTVYDAFDLFGECRWDILVIVNTKPTINVVADDVIIDFGRLDRDRKLPAPPPIPVRPQPDAIPVTGTPLGLIETTFPPSPPHGLCEYYSDTLMTYLRSDYPTVDSFHVYPTQYPWGMTCVFAIVDDAEGDPLTGGFKLPRPLFGRGNFFAAIQVPDADSGGATIPLPEGGTVADILPTGLKGGSIIDTDQKMEAYNATLFFLANSGALPVTAPLPLSPAGAQALPVIWEAPDDPDSPTDSTHDCVEHVGPPVCSIQRGGTVTILGRVTDGFSKEQTDFDTIGYPDRNVVATPTATRTYTPTRTPTYTPTRKIAGDSWVLVDIERDTRPPPPPVANPNTFNRDYQPSANSALVSLTKNDGMSAPECVVNFSWNDPPSVVRSDEPFVMELRSALLGGNPCLFRMGLNTQPCRSCVNTSQILYPPGQFASTGRLEVDVVFRSLSGVDELRLVVTVADGSIMSRQPATYVYERGSAARVSSARLSTLSRELSGL